jgi:hypothetical protein
MGGRTSKTKAKRKRRESSGAGPAPELPSDIVASGPAAPGGLSSEPKWLAARGWIALLALILLMGAAVRLVSIDARSLWGDELWTLSMTVGRGINGGLPANELVEPPIGRVTGLKDAVSWWRIWTDMEDYVTHPPLYFVTLRLWRELFGEGDIAARSLSVVFSLLSILLIYDVGRLLSDRVTGLWAAALLALASPQILYALEVRNYTIQLPFALAAASALLRIEKSGPSWPRLVGLAAALLALVLSHYFAVGAALALGIWGLIRLRGVARLKTIGAMFASAALFLILWMPTMWRQRLKFHVGLEDNFWLYDEAPGRALRALGDCLLIPAKLLTRLESHTLLIGWLIAAVVVAALFAWRKRPDLQLPLLWLLGTIGLITALDMSRSSLHLHFIRYSILGGPGIYLLLSGLLAPYARYRHLPPALAAAWCLLALPSLSSAPYEDWQSGIEDWRAPAAFMRQHAHPDDLIIFSAEGGGPFNAHVAMLAHSHYMGLFRCPIVVATAPPGEELLRQIARRRPRDLWIVTLEAEWVRPQRLFPNLVIHQDQSFMVPATAILWRASWDPPPQLLEPAPPAGGVAPQQP